MRRRCCKSSLWLKLSVVEMYSLEACRCSEREPPIKTQTNTRRRELGGGSKERQEVAGN
jgi:hypothetical protein